MAQIYLIRHGQASFGSQNYDQLSALGAQQSAALGNWLTARGISPDRVVCGAMQRHRQTADGCLDQMTQAGRFSAAAIITDARLNEYHHHEVLVRHHPAFEDPAEVKRFLLQQPNGKQAFQQIFTAAVGRWISGRHDSEYSETWLAFQQRCVAAFQEQLQLNDDARQILVFTSGGTISAICQHLLGFSDQRFAPFNWSLVNTGVSRVHVSQQPGGIQCGLAGLNNFAHLEVLDQPGLITYV